MRHEIRDFSSVIAAGATFNFINEIVPPNCTYVIKEFGNDLSNVLSWTFVSWVFLVNGLAQFPLNDIRDQMGFAAQRQEVQNVRIPGGSRLQVQGVARAGIILGTAVLLSIAYDIEDND